MFGSFSGILAQAFDGKGVWVFPAIEQMFAGTWSSATIWTEVGYIVVQSILVTI